MTSDNDLRRALRRRGPPAGFAERMLARIGDDGASSRRDPPAGARWPSRGTAWVAAGVAAAVLMAAGAAQFRAHRREADARRAARELTLALRITGEKLRDVQARVVNVTRQFGEDRHDHDQPSR